VNRQLAPVSLSDLRRPVERELDLTAAELLRIVSADFPLIRDANRHLMQMKGKLFRPMLLLLSRAASGGPPADMVTLAAVVELIHLATLVHDDSVDHSVLRRGMPTLNALFSHQVSVIMGDYLYSRAVIELARWPDREPLAVLARVTNEMTVGEMRQLEALDKLSYTEAQYQELIRCKTASLFSGACEVGGIGSPPAHRAALREFGLRLGMAFQITDDLLDYTEAEEVTGKPSGLDLKEHKVTLPLIAAMPRLSAAGRGEVEALMATPEPADDQVARVIQAVAAAGGLEAARQGAVEQAERAEAAIETLPESRARDALRDSILYAVERRR
jgi:octaprenyl-diphosphate synthase